MSLIFSFFFLVEMKIDSHLLGYVATALMEDDETEKYQIFFNFLLLASSYGRLPTSVALPFSHC